MARKPAPAAQAGGLHGGLIASREVRTEAGSFLVRGLNAEAIFALFARRRAELGALFDGLVVQGDGGPTLNLEQGASIARLLLEEAPLIAGEIIAMAAGPADEESVAIARALPLGAQLAAMEAIADLTFTSDMPPKKVLEIGARAMGGLAREVTAALATLSAQKA